ncbi:kinase-like domain-containing protein [Phaeosphaeriaceae sp. PMI808]|nr:kinase-like domain-containing protein [Phaeosphaeriaceae sp. PMI808]
MDQLSEMFEYTSGRWIWNDALKHTRGRRLFNVAEFRHLAAAAVNQNSEDIAQFKKLGEGGFNRTFLVTMHDGIQFVGRIPYPGTEPKQLVIASEVATMDFLHLHDLPVPKIYSYSTTSQNPAGTKYLFMELVKGTNLGDIWFDLSGKARISIVNKLVELESRLFELRFPASGSLYYTKDLEAKYNKIDFSDTNSHHNHFCIGPDTRLSLWYGKRLDLQISRGPYKDSVAALAAGANNVFVSDDLSITGLIDWQHCAILPLFLQCGIPNSFQNYGDSVSESLTLPILPQNFDELGERDQFEQVVLLRRRQLHYLYVATTAKLNSTHYDALAYEFSTLRRKLFDHASEPWEGDNVTLKADLIHLTKNWSSIATSKTSGDTISSCPIDFSEGEVKECLRINDEQIDADEQLQACRDAIGVGPEGWVPLDQYDEIKQRGSKLKADALEAAESDEERLRLCEHWVFDDFDEEEYS